MNKSNIEQPLNKQDILSILNKYKFDKSEFIIISGASMVLQDIKKTTHDIDIAVSPNLLNDILEKHQCEVEKEDKESNKSVYYLDNYINFSTNYFDNTQWQYYQGYKIQTADSLLKLKKELNREKDKEDIILIEEYIKTKKSDI